MGYPKQPSSSEHLALGLKREGMSKEPSEESMQLAAQAWCTEETGDIEMDVRLARAFAQILDRVIEAAKQREARSVIKSLLRCKSRDSAIEQTETAKDIPYERLEWYADNSEKILRDISHALESRGYVHYCNGPGVGGLIDDLQLAEAALATAYEKAAKVCDEEALILGGFKLDSATATARRCASSIRALKPLPTRTGYMGNVNGPGCEPDVR